MKENRNSLQKHAMYFGTYMGIYWGAKFVLFPLGFSTPFIMFLFIGLTLGVPFMGYYYTKIYRDKISGGSINFGQACLFNIFMYMFASLFVAVIHYIYYQYIDHGFIVNESAKMIDQITNASVRTDEEKELSKEMISTLSSLSPIELTMQSLTRNVFFGFLLAIPTALFVMKRKSNSSAPI